MGLVRDMDRYEELKEMIKNSKKIVVFTGAGISTLPPTNIKDFRSADGLYNEKTKYNIRPEEIISHSYFVSHPKEFFEFYFSKMVFKDALPNRAHEYFASLEKDHQVTIITQNIDGLHTKAGSSNVKEIHGSVFRNYCEKCHKYYDLKDIKTYGIPYCECGGIIKPDVVLYEEPLDDEVVSEAIKALRQANLLIVVGTSLTVYPAAMYIRYFSGEYRVVINRDKTIYDQYMDLVFNEDIGNVIDRIK